MAALTVAELHIPTGSIRKSRLPEHKYCFTDYLVKVRPERRSLLDGLFFVSFLRTRVSRLTRMREEVTW